MTYKIINARILIRFSLFCTLNFSSNVFSQNTVENQVKCIVDENRDWVEGFFGVPDILQFGKDTINTACGKTIIYSCHTCAISAYNNKKMIWHLNLSQVGLDCQLNTFYYSDSKPCKTMKRDLSEEGRKNYRLQRKGYQLIIQSNNREAFVVNVKNGKIRKLAAAL